MIRRGFLCLGTLFRAGHALVAKHDNEQAFAEDGASGLWHDTKVS